MKLDELMQSGWGDAAHYFHERDMKYGTAELKVLAVVKPQIDMTAATPTPVLFGEHMQALDIVPGQSQIPAVTSRPGSGQRGWVWRNHSYTNSFRFFRPTRRPIQHCFRMRSLLTP